MIFTVPLQAGTVLANVRYKWLAAGVFGSDLTSGLNQPDLTYPIFRIDAIPPDNAEELIVFDSTDSSNWNVANWVLAKFRIGAPTSPTVVVQAPANPDQSTGFIVTRDPTGVPQGGVSIDFTLLSAPNQDSYATTKIKVVSSSETGSVGLLQVPLLKGAKYGARRGYVGIHAEFTVPVNVDSFALPAILGSP